MNQWTKNLLIFIPAFFAGIELTNDSWFKSIIAFLGFSIICSGTYILNDFRDRESDRYHPTKKHRSLDSTNFNVRMIGLLSGVCFVSGLLILYSIEKNLLILGGLYMLNGFAYNFLFKQIIILDVFSLLLGYVIRLYVGASIAGIPISYWLFSMVIGLALVFVLIKRWSDVIVYREIKIVLRRTVLIYDKIHLLQIIKVVLWMTFMIYFAYLGFVYGIFEGRNLVLFPTLVFYSIFVLLLLKSIIKFPHQDPLKMILGKVINVAGMIICAGLFYYVIHIQ